MMNIQDLIQSIDQKLEEASGLQERLEQQLSENNKELLKKTAKLKEVHESMVENKLEAMELEIKKEIKEIPKSERKGRDENQEELDKLKQEIAYAKDPVLMALISNGEGEQEKNANKLQLTTEIEKETESVKALTDKIQLSTVNIQKLQEFLQNLKKHATTLSGEIDYTQALDVDVINEKEISVVLANYAAYLLRTSTAFHVTPGDIDGRLEELGRLIKFERSFRAWSINTLPNREEICREIDLNIKIQLCDIKTQYCDLLIEKNKLLGDDILLENLNAALQLFKKSDYLSDYLKDKEFLHAIPLTTPDTKTHKQKALSPYNFNVAVELMDYILPKNDTSTSPYDDLHKAITKMRTHGKEINDLRVIKLATHLRLFLDYFEKQTNNQNAVVKNEFKKEFLTMLHSEDAAFYEHRNPIKYVLDSIYKALYTWFFDNEKRPPSFFLQYHPGKKCG